MLILDRWSCRFWSLARTTFTLLGAITGLKQNQIKFRQQIPAISPIQDSLTAPELMKCSESKTGTQWRLWGPYLNPDGKTQAVPDEEHWLLQPLYSTWWAPLLHDQSSQRFSKIRPFQTISVCTFVHWKNAYQATNLKGEFLLKKAFGSLTAEWAQLRL